MLFPRNPAKGGTSGPQACLFGEKPAAEVKVGKSFLSLDLPGDWAIMKIRI
jgi:hypothetical protein